MNASMRAASHPTKRRSRPEANSVQPEPLEQNLMRDHILDIASRLFYQNGIRAIGMDRIIAEADIAKATLYRHFATKEQLVVTYLQVRSARVLATMKEEIAAGETPALKVTRLFRRLEQDARSTAFRGCAFTMALAENEDSEAIRNVVRKHKDAVKRVFLEVTGAKRLAEQLAILYDGALASILVYRDPQAAKNASLAAAELLE